MTEPEAPIIHYYYLWYIIKKKYLTGGIASVFGYLKAKKKFFQLIETRCNNTHQINPLTDYGYF